MTVTTAPPTPAPHRRRPSSPVLLAAAGLVLLVVLAMVAVPQLLTGRDPLLVDLAAALQAPSIDHIFGTDQTGRDVFTRVVYGARQSVGVGVLATLLAASSGVLVGSLIGIAPRIVDTVLMRLLDIVLAIPEFLLALIIVAVLGPGPINVALAVTVAAFPVYVRTARAHARALWQEDFVQASRLIGVPAPIALLRHVLPGVARRLSVLATLGVGTAILAVAGLSFLGLGVGEPAPEWGLILSGGRNVLASAWWIAVFPGLAITLTVLATSYLGRRLRAVTERGTR